jgi:hypothetical protein
MTQAMARLRLASLALVASLSLGVAVAAAAERDPIAEILLPFGLPVTSGEVRQIVDLLQAPDRVAVELVEAGQGVADPLARLPGTLWHDLLDTPARHLNLLHAVVSDTLDLGGWLRGKRGPLFGQTVRALHRAQSLTTAAALVDRLTGPENPTIRLLVVVTARAYGVPIDATDLDVVRQSLLRPESGDLAPLVARAVTRLVALYGSDAVRLLLAP